jgi:hypothetical protein
VAVLTAIAISPNLQKSRLFQQLPGGQGQSTVRREKVVARRRESTPARSRRRLILAINFCDRQPQPAAEVRHEDWLGDAVIRLDVGVPHRVSMSRLASQAGP